MESGAGDSLIEPFITYPATQIADVAFILAAAILVLAVIACWPEPKRKRK